MTESTSKDNYYHCNAFIGVHEGNLVYVLIDNGATFDAINLPATEHDNGCISKTQDTGALHLVFQFWKANNKKEVTR